LFNITEKVLIGEGRSPLQILREANSPRGRNSQVITPFLGTTWTSAVKGALRFMLCI